MLDDMEVHYILNLYVNDRFLYIRQMRQNFNEQYYPNQNEVEEEEGGPNNIIAENRLSHSTYYRTLVRNNITRKVVERRKIHVVTLAKWFLVTAWKGIFIPEFSGNFGNNKYLDETKSNPESFLNKWGWSPRGEECLQEQIIIGTRSFSTIAAVTPLGFLCWSIYEFNISHVEYCDFIRDVLSPALNDQQVGIIDNATTHHHAESLDQMDICFQGKYYFVPAYSPHLKPIEPCCFKLVKNYIRNHEQEALLDPVCCFHECDIFKILYWRWMFWSHIAYVEWLLSSSQ